MIKLIYKINMKINLVSPRKLKKNQNLHFFSEIRNNKTNSKINGQEDKKLSFRQTPQNNILPLKLTNNNINNHLLSNNLATATGFFRLNTSQNKSKESLINNSNVKLYKLISTNSNSTDEICKNKILQNIIDSNNYTPLNNNKKLKLKLDKNISNNKLLYSNKENIKFLGSFRELNINKNIIKKDDINSTKSKSYYIFNFDKEKKLNRNDYEKKKSEFPPAHIKTESSEYMINEQKDRHMKIVLNGGQDTLFKKKLLINDSKIDIYENKNTKKLKIYSLNKDNESSNAITIKSLKDENLLIKESITDTSMNESKIKKGENTIEFKNILGITINCANQTITDYCPEEIHFYYVKLVQGGKNFEQHIQGE